MKSRFLFQKSRFRISSLRAFTFVEVLFVMLILGVLAALVIPSVQQQLVESRGSAETENLRVLQGAKLAWMKDHPGQELPESTSAAKAALLPYLAYGWPESPWGTEYEGINDINVAVSSPVNGDPQYEPKGRDVDLIANGFNDLGLSKNVYLVAPDIEGTMATWTGGPGYTAPPPVTPPDSWTLTLNVSPFGAGTTTGAGTFSSGVSAAFDAFPADATWRFVEWTGDLAGSPKAGSISGPPDRVGTAVFERIMWDLTVVANPPQGGSVTPATTTSYVHQSWASADATANSGWRLVSFTGDTDGGTVSVSAPSGSVTDLLMDRDRTVTANFEQLGTLTVRKVVDGTNVPSSASFTVRLEGPDQPGLSGGSREFTFSSSGGDQVVSGLIPGTYTLSEPTVPDEFTSSGPASVSLAAGGSEELVITNTFSQDDVVVGKTADAASVNVGESGVFTLTVSNPSAYATESLTLEDTLPAGTTPTGASVTSGPGSVSLSGNTVSWSGVLTPGGSVIIEVPYTMDTEGPKTNVVTVGSLTASATVTGVLVEHELEVQISPVGAAAPVGAGTFTHGTTTPHSFNGKGPSFDFVGWSGHSTATTPSSDILMDEDKTVVANFVGVSKIADSSSYVVGTLGVFTITVSNPSSLASGVKSMTDVLPAGLVATGASLSGPGSVSRSGNVVTWTGSLGSGQVAVITIPFTMNAEGTFVNTAQLDGGGSASYTVTGTPDLSNSVDLGIYKDGSGASVSSPVNYSLTVYNSTDVDSTGVVVTDVLPPGAVYGDDFYGYPGSATYNAATRTLTWTIGDFYAYDSAYGYYSVTYPTGGAKENVATVTSNEPDSDPSDNTDNEIVNLFDTPYTVTVLADPPEAADAIYGEGSFFPTENVNSSVYFNPTWQFTHWSGIPAGGYGSTASSWSDYVYAEFAMPEEDVVITAHFEARPSYNLEIQVLNENTGAPVPASDYTVDGAGPYLPSTLANVRVTYEAARWEFVRWEGALDNGPDPNAMGWGTLPVFMDGNKAAVLYLRPKTFTLTMLVNPEGAGTATQGVSSGVYAPGEVATFSASANPGNTFANFSYHLGGSAGVTVSGSTGTAVMDRDRVIIANFNLGYYTLQVIPVPAEGGTTTGSGSYSMTTNAYFSATPASGYVFREFTGDVNGMQSNVWGDRWVPMLQNRVIYAHFDEAGTTAPSVDVFVGKSAYNYSAFDGAPWYFTDYFSYSVTVGNNGPETAQDVVITDVLPAGTTVDYLYVDGGSVVDNGDGTITWTIGELPAGWNFSMSYDASFASPGQKTNVATVTTSSNDVNLSNNQDSESFMTYDPALSDLRITKSVSSSSVGNMGTDSDGTRVIASGARFSYILQVSLGGSQNATGVVVEDVLPPGVTGVSWNATGYYGDPYGSGAITGSSITIPLGSMWANETVYITIVCDAPVVTEEVRVTNTATASMSLADSNPSNNTASVDTIFVPSTVDMNLTKFANPVFGGVGEEMSWDIAVSSGSFSYTLNSGATVSGASVFTGGYTVVDTVPAGMTIVRVESEEPSFEYTVSGRTVTARFPGPNLVAGVFRIVCTADAAGTFDNSATLTLDVPEDNLSNNTATATYRADTGVNSPNVVITKSASPTNLVNSPAGHSSPGTSTTRYTIRVTNTGPVPVDGIQVQDVLPSGLTTATTLNWNVGTLTPGNYWQIQYQATASIPGLVGMVTLENRAEVTTTTPGEDPSDNVAVAPVNVYTGVVDASVQKTGASRIMPGGRMSYSIVVGASTAPGFSYQDAYAYNLVLRDTLPAGVTYVSHSYSSSSNPQPVITVQGGELVATWPGPFRGQGTITLTVDVPVGAYEPGDIISNTATIETTSYDPVPENDSSTWETLVSPVEVTLRKWASNAVVDLSQNPWNISWVLEVTNETEVVIASATVVDHPPNGAATQTFTFSNLQPGQSYTRTVYTAVPPGATAGTVLENRAVLTLPAFPDFGPVWATATVLLQNYSLPPAGEVSRYSRSTDYFAFRYGFSPYTDVGASPSVDVQLFKKRTHTADSSANISYSATRSNKGRSQTDEGDWWDNLSSGGSVTSSGGGSSTFSLSWEEEMSARGGYSRDTSTITKMDYGPVVGSASIATGVQGFSGGNWTWQWYSSEPENRDASGSWNMSTTITRTVTGNSATGMLTVRDNTTNSAGGSGTDKWQGWYTAGWSVKSPSPSSTSSEWAAGYGYSLNSLTLTNPPGVGYEVTHTGNPPVNAWLSNYMSPFGGGYWGFATYPDTYSWGYQPGTAKGSHLTDGGRRGSAKYTGTYLKDFSSVDSDQYWSGQQGDSNNGSSTSAYGTSSWSSSWSQRGSMSLQYDWEVENALSEEYSSSTMMGEIGSPITGGTSSSAYCRLDSAAATRVSACSTDITVLVSLPALKAGQTAKVLFQVNKSASYVPASQSTGRASGGAQTVRERVWEEAETYSGPRDPQVVTVTKSLPWSRSISVNGQGYTVASWQGGTFVTGVEWDASGRVKVEIE